MMDFHEDFDFHEVGYAKKVDKFENWHNRLFKKKKKILKRKGPFDAAYIRLREKQKENRKKRREKKLPEKPKS